MSTIQISRRSLISISAALAATSLLDTRIHSAAKAATTNSQAPAYYRFRTGDKAFLTFHFPWPGLGHVTKAGEGFRYIAAPMQMVL
jgi:hypothetical protein